MSSIEIIIADDEKSVHEDIKKSLESVRDPFFDFEIINEFYDTFDLKQFLISHELSKHAHTILLLDNIFDGNPDGLQALDLIHHICPDLPIIMLTTVDADPIFFLAKEKYNIDYLQKPANGKEIKFHIESAITNIKNLHIHKDLKKEIAKVAGKIDKLDENTKNELAKVNEKIDNLTDIIKNDIQNKINKSRSSLDSQIHCFKEDTPDYDSLMSKFILEISNYINNKMNQSDNLIAKEKDDLKERFASYWDRLQETSRASLVSAHVIWKRCENISEKNFDYSGVCICATSALESELRKIFFDGFKSYIKEEYGSPSNEKWQKSFNIWPELLLTTTKAEYEKSISNNTHPHIELSTNFTLGTLPYLFGQKSEKDSDYQSKKIQYLMNEYLSTIVKSTNKNDPLSEFYNNKSKPSFVSKCNKVRKEYRNPAAHTNIIQKTIAKDCLENITGDTGLLITLYSLLQ